jgi:pyridoxal biosynthesis lyase PdxS
VILLGTHAAPTWEQKTAFKTPFVCGARDLGEALRRVSEGAVMIRTKGEAGTGNVVEAVRHMRQINADIRRVKAMDPVELHTYAKDIRAPFELVKQGSCACLSLFACVHACCYFEGSVDVVSDPPLRQWQSSDGCLW